MKELKSASIRPDSLESSFLDFEKGPAFSLSSMPHNSPMESIEHDLLEMASRAELMIGRSVDAFVLLDAAEARATIDSDDKIDRLDLQIEIACLKLLAEAEPSLSEHPADLLRVGTILKIITDVERVGDLSVEIARCALDIEGELGDVRSIDVRRMANLARLMFHSAIEGFVRQSIDSYALVHDQETEVDQLFLEFRTQIFDHMRQKPEEVVALSAVLLAINHLERIADHALNICERVTFMITGELHTHAPTTPRADAQ